MALGNVATTVLSGTSTAVTVPAHTAGDVLVMVVRATAAVTPMEASPDLSGQGWDKITGADQEAGDASAIRVTFYEKVGNGSESSVTVGTWTNTVGGRATVIQLTGRDAGDLVADTDFTLSEATQGVSTPTGTAAHDDTDVIWAFMYDDDASSPTNYDGSVNWQGTSLDYGEAATPGNGYATAVGHDNVAAGTIPASTYQSNGDTDAAVAIFVAFNPITAGIADVDSDYGAGADEFDLDDDSLDVNSQASSFAASSNTVYLSADDTLAGGATEVDITAGITAEDADTITLDLTSLTTELAALESLVATDGHDLHLIVDTGSDEYSLPVTVHRAKAFALAASANITASGEDTTSQLAAPASGSTFGGGRIQDDENPGDAVDLDTDEHREDETALAGITPSDGTYLGAQAGETYDFRLVHSDGTPLDTYTVTPQLTIAAGGTTTQRSMAGAVTPAGNVSRETQATKVGTLAPAGAAARETAKTAAGTVGPAGATSREAAKTLAGAATPTGSEQHNPRITRGGTLPLAGAATRTTSRSLAGTLGSAAALARHIAKTATGATTPAGTLETIRLRLLAIAGSLGLTGTVSRETSQTRGGTVPAAGTLARDIAHLAAGTLEPAGTTTRHTAATHEGDTSPSGTVSRETATRPAGTLTPEGTTTRATRKAVAGALAGAGALARRTAKRVAGAIAGAGTVATELVGAFQKHLQGALSPAGTLRRRTSKAKEGAVAPAGTYGPTAVTQAHEGTVTPAGAASTARTVARLVQGALAAAGILVRRPGKRTAGTTTPTSTLGRTTRATKASTLDIAGHVTKATTRSLAGILGAAGTVATQVFDFLAPPIAVRILHQARRRRTVPGPGAGPTIPHQGNDDAGV